MRVPKFSVNTLIEIAVGAFAAVLTALALEGVSLGPFFILGGLTALVYLTFGGRVGAQAAGGLQGNPTSIPAVKFDDIGGQESAKRELCEGLEFINDPERVRDLGIRPLKGLLLVGPPGTGKTMLAKAAANYTNSVFIPVSGSEFVEIYAGVGAKRVRQVFANARKQAKKSTGSAVVFIDEIDVLGGHRGKHSSHLEYDQTLNQLLVEMDGISTADDTRILVIAATNRVDLLDPALLRPGRFDRIIRVDLPEKEGRLKILQIHTRNKPIAEDVDLEVIAQETYGFSGAHLESLANEAAILALRSSEDSVRMAHFREAIEKVMMGEKTDRQPSRAELERIAVHEIGHGLVGEIVRPGSVSSVAITPRSNALGYVRNAPRDDMYLYTKEHLEGQIKICLAGCIAEDVVCGSRSTGAASDFEQAFKFARQIIDSGMSELGIVSRDDLPRATYNRTLTQIISKQEDIVRSYVEGAKNRIFEASRELIKRERISGDELRRLLALQDTECIGA
ncbi:MAG: AAA family ATPase [Bacillota bacterium]|jgi:vesicle-fusing ATPase|nr:AAA family ATPase [Bacillota bacterium]HOB91060.1 AAA family ATPase [Bacillota bacterium]HPZ54186.1 AAA family ATPase [Bacillota bacterium]HQD18281.1 AAA family ATPase [Bacillota bacterium]